MKNSFFIWPFLMFLLVFSPSQGQEEISISGGTGTPEMINVGLRLRADQYQYAVYIGTNIAYKNENYNASLDFYYHFGGRSMHTSLQPWFVKTGLTYMVSEGEWEKRTDLLLVPRMGREFNITSEFGVALEAGVMLMLMDKNVPKKERTGEVTGDLDLIGSGFVQPSAGVKFYYRL